MSIRTASLAATLAFAATPLAAEVQPRVRYRTANGRCG